MLPRAVSLFLACLPIAFAQQDGDDTVVLQAQSVLLQTQLERIDIDKVGECPATCFGYSCNELADTGTPCADLVSADWGCDCTGCSSCYSAPASNSAPAPTPRPWAAPAPTPVPWAPQPAVGTTYDDGISAADWDLLGGGVVQYSDIQQGALGDCYFLAAISAVAYTHPELIKGMFTKGSLLRGAHPVYTTKWLLNGKPTNLAVNNMIPANLQTGLPYFVQEKGGNYWPLVLEKAWAKLFGDYKTIEAGLQRDVFQALTQAPIERFSHSQTTTTDAKNALWNKIVAGTSEKLPMGTDTASTPPGNIGVVGGHAYVLLGAFGHTSADGTYYPQTLQIFNPHHNDRYTGAIPNPDKNDGSFYITFDEYLISFSSTTIANVITGAQLSHTVIPKDTAMALEFTMSGDSPFAVQLEWANKRLLKGCGVLNPKYAMLVANAGALTSPTAASNPSGGTNARADMVGGSGKYYVFATGSFPTMTVLQEFIVNIYGKEAPTISVSSDYSNAYDLFLAMKGMCKTISVVGTGSYGDAAQYTWDESTLVNSMPVFKATATIAHMQGYEIIFWSPSSQKFEMGSSVDEAQGGTYFPSMTANVNSATCVSSLIQEIASTESASRVDVPPLRLAEKKLADTQEHTDIELLSDSSASAYSLGECSNALARMETLDSGEQIASAGKDYVFPETLSSIAAAGVNCGDSAIDQSIPCETYNNWMSIADMKKLATSFKGNLEGGCIQKAMFNGQCLIDTTLCQTSMILTCPGYSAWTIQMGARSGGNAETFCGTCTATSA